MEASGIKFRITGKQAAVAAIIVVELALLVAIVLIARGSRVPEQSVVVAPSAAGIIVAPQRYASDRVVIDRVKTPVPGWVVLTADKNGVSGKVIGAAKVRAGDTQNVDVILMTNPVPTKIHATLYASSGEAGAGMGGAKYGKLVVAGSQPVTTSFTVKPFTRMVSAGDAVVGTATLMPAQSSVVVSSVVAPGPSWLVVAEPGATPDQPGPVVGVVAVAPGTSSDVAVPISAVASGSPNTSAPTSSSVVTSTPSGYSNAWGNLTVFLFADQGDPLNRVFEFHPGAPASSPDEPYVVDGAAVSTPVNASALFTTSVRK